MRMEYEVRRYVQRVSSRWADGVQFIGSVLALWAVCAAGIYLIGPSESEIASEQALGTRALAGGEATLAAAAYKP